MAYSGNKGFSRVLKASRYSWQGVRAAYQHEEAFRQEVWLCLVLLPAGLYLGNGGLEKALLVACVMLVPVIEIINSAIEAVVDRFGDEMHELSGRAKDMGSAAVAMAIALLVTVWILVLFF